MEIGSIYSRSNFYCTSDIEEVKAVPSIDVSFSALINHSQTTIVLNTGVWDVNVDTTQKQGNGVIRVVSAYDKTFRLIHKLMVRQPVSSVALRSV